MPAKSTTVQDLGDFIDHFAPPRLAEEWDNVGLLLGDTERTVERVMTCLTVTSESADEAVSEQVDLIVAHHPLPFRPLTQITTQSLAGRLVLQLLESRIALISPHTCFDSARLGINQLLAEGIGLHSIQPLIAETDASSELGSGRQGSFDEPISLASVARRLETFLQINHMHRVGNVDQPITRVAVGCGSAGQFLTDAVRHDCQLLVTGETNFHTCLEAVAQDVCVLLPGHYASERFAIESLASTLQQQFPQLQIWASRREQDPICWDTFA